MVIVRVFVLFLCVTGSEGVVIPVKYLGCMIHPLANESRATNYRGSFGLKAKVDRVSVNSCVYKCYAFRFSMAAMARSTVCYCGSNTRNLVWRRDEFCFRPCQGNCRQRCGGEAAMSVYQTGYQKEPDLTFEAGILRKGHIGCFRMKSLPFACPKQRYKPLLRSPRMTGQLCALYCQSGRKFEQMEVSVLMSTDECCCGKNRQKAYDMSHRVSDKHCNIPCMGDPRQNAFFDKTQCVGTLQLDKETVKTFTAWDTVDMVNEGMPSEPRSVFSAKAGWIAPQFRNQRFELMDGIFQYNLDARKSPKRVRRRRNAGKAIVKLQNSHFIGIEQERNSRESEEINGSAVPSKERTMKSEVTMKSESSSKDLIQIEIIRINLSQCLSLNGIQKNTPWRNVNEDATTADPSKIELKDPFTKTALQDKENNEIMNKKREDLSMPVITTQDSNSNNSDQPPKGYFIPKDQIWNNGNRTVKMGIISQDWNFNMSADENHKVSKIANTLLTHQNKLRKLDWKKPLDFTLESMKGNNFKKVQNCDVTETDSKKTPPLPSTKTKPWTKKTTLNRGQEQREASPLFFKEHTKKEFKVTGPPEKQLKKVPKRAARRRRKLRGRGGGEQTSVLDRRKGVKGLTGGGLRPGFQPPASPLFGPDNTGVKVKADNQPFELKNMHPHNLPADQLHTGVQRRRNTSNTRVSHFTETLQRVHLNSTKLEIHDDQLQEMRANSRPRHRLTSPSKVMKVSKGLGQKLKGDIPIEIVRINLTHCLWMKGIEKKMPERNKNVAIGNVSNMAPKGHVDSHLVTNNVSGIIMKKTPGNFSKANTTTQNSNSNNSRRLPKEFFMTEVQTRGIDNGVAKMTINAQDFKNWKASKRQKINKKPTTMAIDHKRISSNMDWKKYLLNPHVPMKNSYEVQHTDITLKDSQKHRNTASWKNKSSTTKMTVDRIQEALSLFFKKEVIKATGGVTVTGPREKKLKKRRKKRTAGRRERLKRGQSSYEMPELKGKMEEDTVNFLDGKRGKPLAPPIIDPDNTGVKVIDIPETEEESSSAVTIFVGVLACLLILVGIGFVLFKKKHRIKAAMAGMQGGKEQNGGEGSGRTGAGDSGAKEEDSQTSTGFSAHKSENSSAHIGTSTDEEVRRPLL